MRKKFIAGICILLIIIYLIIQRPIGHAIAKHIQSLSEQETVVSVIKAPVVLDAMVVDGPEDSIPYEIYVSTDKRDIAQVEPSCQDKISVGDTVYFYEDYIYDESSYQEQIILQEKMISFIILFIIALWIVLFIAAALKPKS